jgi:hypothetical protein
VPKAFEFAESFSKPFCMTKLFGVLYPHQALQKDLNIVKGSVDTYLKHKQ